MTLTLPPAIEPNVAPPTDEPFQHYYDAHPTREDLMGSSAAHSRLIIYLISLLDWLYHMEGWFVVGDLNLYQYKRRYEHPITPDVALFKGVVVEQTAQQSLRSWQLYEPDRPPPQLVFEICSQATWEDDLDVKPARYAALGVSEYFAYDPNEPPYLPGGVRLRGWRLAGGQAEELPLDAAGRLWSKELDSYLVPDGALLRITDRDGRPRLTQAEAERAAKEAERTAKEAAWARLRALGIDPDSLG